MCGIAGVWRFDGAPVREELLDAMGNLLVHRGPDAGSQWHNDQRNLGFVHRRLSIIDVESSAQPMVSAQGMQCIVYNGEIFNYKMLRKSLDYPFRTNGDTEVLLAGLTSIGPDFLEECQGQFAFAFWDEETDSIYMARDRIGVLPLYYYANNERLVFGSEIKALVPALPKALEIDEASVADYLAYRSVHAPHTLLRGIHKVKPGHVLRVSSDGRTTEVPYWRISDESQVRAFTEHEAKEVLSATLSRAVNRSLVADVPVGSYLSGGLDSSLTVAMMARRSEHVNTFAAGFGDPRFDELPFAKQVSDLFNTQHHEVHISAADFSELWPKLTWHRDAPLSEPADVAVFRLAELARQHVKVVLSGEGSDELFAGYPKYRAAPLAESLLMVPTSVREPVFNAMQSRLPTWAEKVRIALRALSSPDPDERAAGWFAPFTPLERIAFLGTPGRRTYELAMSVADGSFVRRMLVADCSTWLPDNLLERGDRMSMASSVELRPPFLDEEVVDLAFSMPTRFKMRGKVGKWIVKRVAEEFLPKEIIYRKKVGFRVPLDAWFRSGLRDVSHDLLIGHNSHVSHLVDRAQLHKLLARHESGRANEDIRIWTLLSLEMWFRHSFDEMGKISALSRRKSGA